MAAKKISIAFVFGLITAASMILFILALYWAGPKVFVGQIAFLSYAIVIALGATAALVQKKANNGWLSFQEAVRICFTVFVLGLAARTLFPWLLVNVIDPHFKLLVKPEMIANAERGYRSLGVPEDTVRQQIEAMKTDEPFPLSSMLLLLAMTMIVYFLMALLIAAVVKRKPDEPAPTRDPQNMATGDPQL